MSILSASTMSALVLIALSTPRVEAGSITLNVSDTLLLSSATVPDGFAVTNDAVCTGPPSPAQCVTANPAGLSVSGASILASAPADDSAPAILSVAAQVSSPNQVNSNFTLRVENSQPFTDYGLFPDVSLAFSPGYIGAASLLADQITVGSDGTGEFRLTLGISGPSNASFSLDSATGAMSLAVSAGDMGSITLDQWFNGAETTLLQYVFGLGVVTASNNTLGIPLPGYGASPSFSLVVDPFETTMPAINAGSDTYNLLQTAAAIEAPVPEPGALMLTMVGLAVFSAMRLIPKGFAKRVRAAAIASRL